MSTTPELLGLPGLRLEEAGHRCTAGTHSRLADGRTLCWRPSWSPAFRHAVDAELTAQPVPEALSRRLPSVGRDDPWGWWTRAEVCAKLLDVPIIVWVTRHGWPHEGELVVEGQVVRLSTHRGDGLVLSLGRLAPAAAG